jgi:hypothetical protein
MKLKVLALCLALGACASLEYPETTPTGRSEAPAPQSRGDDQRVEVPHNRDDRVERASAAAECAARGRVEERRNNGEYACVRPADANTRANPD